MLSVIKSVAPIFLYVHIAAGLAALILFWVPIFSRKGGVNHRRAGNCYVIAMWLVVITAVLLSIKNVIITNYISAAFLGFLALITARPLWSGISILKNKRTLDSKHLVIDRVLLAMMIVFGGTLIFIGFAKQGHPMANVILVFGVLGVSNIVEFIRSFSRNNKILWLNTHIYCLCVTGIASHTAFLVFGASSFVGQIFTSHWLMLPWFLPTAVGIIGIAIANRRFNAI